MEFAPDSNEGRGEMRGLKGNGSLRGSFIRQSGGGVKGTNRGMDGSVYADWFYSDVAARPSLGEKARNDTGDA